MLNYIWAVMIAIGLFTGALTGINIEAVANGALESAGEAVQLCITMVGIMALWVGLMEIAKNSGADCFHDKGIQPFVSFCFPGSLRTMRQGSIFQPTLLPISWDWAGPARLPG